MSSTSDLLTEITGYERLLAKVEAYRTDYASGDADLTIRIIQHCIERRQQEISKGDTGDSAGRDHDQIQPTREIEDLEKAVAARQVGRS